MAKKPAKPTEQASPRMDGLKNVITGLGDEAQDKRLAVTFLADRHHQQYLEEIYRGDDMAARIVDAIPNEMFREGFEVSITGDKDLSEELDALLEDMGVATDLHQAECWRRAYGGAGLLLGANDGATDLRLPLNLANLRSLDWVALYSPQELQVTRWYNDTRSGKFGEPLIYRLQPLNAPGLNRPNGDPWPEVHESRVIRFDGVRVSRRQRYEHWNYGWGDSVLVRCLRVIWDFQQAHGNASALLQDFAQGVYKMAGLAELVAANKAGVVQERVKLANYSKSTLRAMLVDARDDYDRKTTPISGLAEMLEKFSLRLAAAANMPVSLLMGQSPAGLNATGDSDIRWFYDHVASLQRKSLRPALLRLLKVIFACKKGPTRGVEPDAWTVNFPSLWQLSPDEEAKRRLAVAQADQIYLQEQVTTPAEVGTSRFGGDEYSAETKIDLDLRDKMAEGDEEKLLEPPADPAPPVPVPGQRPKPGALPPAPVPPAPAPKPEEK